MSKCWLSLEVSEAGPPNRGGHRAYRRHVCRQPLIYSTTDLWEIRGAVARGSAESRAYNGRGATYLNPEANSGDNAAAANLARCGWRRRASAAGATEPVVRRPVHAGGHCARITPSLRQGSVA
jgi:hypothetical protein